MFKVNKRRRSGAFIVNFDNEIAGWIIFKKEI